MGDVFKEQLVAQQMSKKDKIQSIIITVVAVALGFIAFILGKMLLGPILVVVIGFGAMFILKKYKKEYEYILTNNELDIDVIYNQEKRKRLLTIDLKQMDMMASIKDEKHLETLKRPQKSINASDGLSTKETYAILYPVNGEMTRILMTPNEEMCHLIYKQAPHKVHLLKY